MAKIAEQGIGQGDATWRHPHQGGGTGFLQPGGAEGPAQSALHLLGRFQPTGKEGIGQVRRKPVIAHKTGNLLNEVHLPGQIEGPGRRDLHQPTLVLPM